VSYFPRAWTHDVVRREISVECHFVDVHELAARPVVSTEPMSDELCWMDDHVNYQHDDSWSVSDDQGNSPYSG
jgi:hypothetical protein